METALHFLAVSEQGGEHHTLHRGGIVEFTAGGEIVVEDQMDFCTTPCDFLRTSAANPPSLKEGDLVLYVKTSGGRGCVLGLIQKWAPPPSDFQVLLQGQERIELRCGKSSVTMTKEGKIVIKGVEVISRASGVNKVKGAAVRIN
jgi:hypothetical protein